MWQYEQFEIPSSCTHTRTIVIFLDEMVLNGKRTASASKAAKWLANGIARQQKNIVLYPLPCCFVDTYTRSVSVCLLDRAVVLRKQQEFWLR